MFLVTTFFLKISLYTKQFYISKNLIYYYQCLLLKQVTYYTKYKLAKSFFISFKYFMGFMKQVLKYIPKKAHTFRIRIN